MRLMPVLLRKTLLTLHVGLSVSSLGAVACFLLLALHGLSARPGSLLTYGAMTLIATQLILPLCLGALVTGVVQSLGTAWGLTKHYWVLMKLVLTVVTIGVLMVQLPGIAALAALGEQGNVSAAPDAARISVLLHATGGLVVLAAILVLSVVKPAGQTPWSVRRPGAA